MGVGRVSGERATDVAHRPRDREQDRRTETAPEGGAAQCERGGRGIVREAEGRLPCSGRYLGGVLMTRGMYPVDTRTSCAARGLTRGYSQVCTDEMWTISIVPESAVSPSS